MKIIIPGGSGQVGTVLATAFQSDGHLQKNYLWMAEFRLRQDHLF